MSAIFSSIAAGVAASAVGAGVNALMSSGSSTTSGGGSGIEKGTIIKTGQGFDANIIKALQGLILGPDFKKKTALADSQNAMLGAMQQVTEKYIPSIGAARVGSGMMGDSMSQILTKRAATDAAVRGAEVKLNTVNSYNTNLTNLLNSLAQGQGSTEKRDINRIDTSQKSSSSGMCYITSIVCSYLQLPDDCEVLSVLRWFRDSMLLDPKYPDRNALVKEYYDQMEVISNAMNALSGVEKDLLYQELYNEHLFPITRNIVAGQYESAIAAYKYMVGMIKERLAIDFIASVSPTPTAAITAHAEELLKAPSFSSQEDETVLDSCINTTEDIISKTAVPELSLMNIKPSINLPEDVPLLQAPHDA